MVGSNSDINAVEKLHYLRSQVSGDASRLIANIAITKENFARAWTALTSRYENKRLLVNSYLNRLFELKPLTQATCTDLKNLLATVKESLGALESLGVPVQQWDVLMVYFVARKLDPKILEAWELHLGESTELANFSQLELFLESRLRTLEAVGSRNSSSKVAAGQKPASKPKASARALAAVATNSTCSFCSSAHYIASCPDFATKSVVDRHDFVLRKSLCFNCLGAHRLNDCRSVKRCRRCKKQHHTLLHREAASPSPQTNAAIQNNASVSPPGTNAGSVAFAHLASSHVTKSTPPVLLATVRVRLLSDANPSLVVRVLLN
ncbi:hypothetical protein X777_07701 [Ooceraea biroi]|nr:hypothetical protein X777_07701 [Ooceraea biroi]